MKTNASRKKHGTTRTLRGLLLALLPFVLLGCPSGDEGDGGGGGERETPKATACVYKMRLRRACASSGSSNQDAIVNQCSDSACRPRETTSSRGLDCVTVKEYFGEQEYEGTCEDYERATTGKLYCKEERSYQLLDQRQRCTKVACQEVIATHDEPGPCVRYAQCADHCAAYNAYKYSTSLSTGRLRRGRGQGVVLGTRSERERQTGVRLAEHGPRPRLSLGDVGGDGVERHHGSL
jgi:hypothetical protein